LVQSPAKRVALAIIGALIVSLLSGVAGMHIADTRYQKAQHDWEQRTYAFNQAVTRSVEDRRAYDLATNPCGYLYRQNNIPFYRCNPSWGESALDDEMDNSLTVLPAPNPLDIRLLQSDGGSIQCKPFRGIARKSAPADGVVAINNTLLELSTNWSGDLTLSPLDSSIQSRRIVIVANNAHAAWLPATAAGSSVTLTAYDWLPDITMWWHLQVCTPKNG
jgi:hypothetical protein